MSIDWKALHRIRAQYLSGTPGAVDYWETEEDLAAYDATYAQRIAWKWQAVLEDLARLGWTPPSGGVLQDWGCGSGVAGRLALATWGVGYFSRLALWDRSPIAIRFARGRAKERFPEVDAGGFEPGPIGLLVISHVINELTPEQRHELLEVIRRAETVIWVEPGSSDESRRLVALRELLRSEFRIVAPCPHCGPCGTLAPGRERDWCHFFARPPTNAFTDPEWAKFANELNIDLRSLPYSYLVLDRRPATTPAPHGVRLLGRPHGDKVAMRTVACHADGTVDDLALPWRTEKAACKLLDKRPHTSWLERAES